MLLTLAAACGEPTGPTSPIAAYTLASVDSKQLPATMYSDTGYTVVVTAGAITLLADGKYTSSTTTRETVDGNVSVYIDRGAGTWVQTSEGGAITLTPTSGPPTVSAVWSGRQLTVTQSDGVYIYSSTG